MCLRDKQLSAPVDLAEHLAAPSGAAAGSDAPAPIPIPPLSVDTQKEALPDSRLLAALDHLASALEALAATLRQFGLSRDLAPTMAPPAGRADSAAKQAAAAPTLFSVLQSRGVTQATGVANLLRRVVNWQRLRIPLLTRIASEIDAGSALQRIQVSGPEDLYGPEVSWDAEVAAIFEQRGEALIGFYDWARRVLRQLARLWGVNVSAIPISYSGLAFLRVLLEASFGEDAARRFLEEGLLAPEHVHGSISGQQEQWRGGQCRYCIADIVNSRLLRATGANPSDRIADLSDEATAIWRIMRLGNACFTLEPSRSDSDSEIPGAVL